MENNTPAAGKTAKVKLSDEQQNMLVEVTKTLGVAYTLAKQTDSQSPKSVIVVHNGIDTPVALTSNKDIHNYIDANGRSIETMYAPRFFEYVNEYFVDLKNKIIDDILTIYEEGDAL